jgi:hypothetical protein
LPSANYGKPPYTQLHQQGVDLRGNKALPEMAFRLYVQSGATKTVALGWEARKAPGPAQACAFYGSGAGQFVQDPGEWARTRSAGS